VAPKGGHSADFAFLGKQQLPCDTRAAKAPHVPLPGSADLAKRGDKLWISLSKAGCHRVMSAGIAAASGEGCATSPILLITNHDCGSRSGQPSKPTLAARDR
jgi:hypothetical protein